MKFLIPLLIFFLILVLLAFVAYILFIKRKKFPAAHIFIRIYTWLLWSGIVGVVLLFFRYEGIPFLSMRFVLLAWIFTVVGWGMYVVFFYRRRYPKMVKDFKMKQEKERFFKKRS